MLPAEALAIWSECCRSAGTDWYLYAETLLCAHGYGTFPDMLKNAQVAVSATDLTSITEQVFPKLPSDWSLDMHLFAVSKSPVCFRQGESVVLEIHVLCPMEDQNQTEAFSAKIRKIRANARTKIKILNLLDKGLGHAFTKSITRICGKIDKKAFYQLISCAKETAQSPLFFCDHLTSKSSITLPKDLFTQTDRLICDGIAYPVFPGYQRYLENVYGDYENGLFDEIGCGLTAEDKEELRHHQARCKEALAFIQALSEEYSLRYYLLAGSVLGCVRHGGFVPWDDDIDIGIRIEDLAHFEAVVKEQLPLRLPEGFKLMQSGANNAYPRMFSKICYEGRCCIDLWPLVPTYTNGFRAIFTWYFAKIITKAHYQKIGHKVTRFVKIVKFMCLLMTDRMIMWFARFNERKYKNRKTPAYINLYSIYRREKETILRDWLDAEAAGNFDGISVPIVGCTEDYLIHLYGDYMAKPAPWKRASRHVARFDTPDSK